MTKSSPTHSTSTFSTPTKIIPEELIPVQLVGRLVLDRMVDNFFAETEQVAFCTQNIVPGIDFTNDPLLQGRNFSYLDTQLKRLGSPNFTHLPINAPQVSVGAFPAGRAYGDEESEGPRQLRAQLLGRARRTARESRARLHVIPGRSRRAEDETSLRKLRRSLQPGAAILHQPDADRAQTHWRCARLRTEQVRAPGRSLPSRLASLKHRRCARDARG